MSPGLAYALVWVGFVAYLGVLGWAPSLGRRAVRGTIVLFVTGFALAPVLLSHDVYSYVDYARLGVLHGLDPYAFPPSSAPGDPAYAEVEWTEATSAYGPLFTLATYPLAWLPVGVAVASLKALGAVSVLGLAALVARLAAARGIEPLRAAAFVALNPLVLVHVVGGAHNDGPAMLLAMLGISATLAALPASAGFALLAAATVKLPAALVAPFALLGAGRAVAGPSGGPPNGRILRASESGRGTSTWPVNRFLVGAALALVAIGVASYAAFDWSWLGAVGLAGESQDRTSHMSVPITVARLTGIDAGAIRLLALLLYAALVAYLLAWTWRGGGDWLRAAAWASLGLLLATSWLLPWYLIWALPLAALARDRPLQLLTLALTAFQLTTRIPI